ncbi:hypothetical protein PR202_gb09478 [Eleusine coracana subsp. coracana]|uniref:non-specific serine/threonine protein kinase n=1 Tax=Eleusine coracana subsp. coracana TaxID=191504 RepID=A0AAV5EFQ4_ELECO|nr:hypothetical protein PR202_gb09478 [Eleusine coracana subsp. coracana]
MPNLAWLVLIGSQSKILRFKLIKEVGDGTFGSVWRAINKQNSEVVAVKKMKKKYYSFEECMSLREVKSLRRMNHPNIVKLKEVIRENDILYFIMEYMEYNLYQLMKDRVKPFSESEVRNWYRAPEVLLQSSVYDSAVDMWAMGAIMAELLTLHPLFPGTSEADEILKICNVIGSPDEQSWPEGLSLAETMKYKFPQVKGNQLSEVMTSASSEAIDLISSLCTWDPCKRPNATEVLQHAFFQGCTYVPPPVRPKVGGPPKTPPGVGAKGISEHSVARRFSTGTLSAMKSNASVKSNALSKTGVQRKLQMERQAPLKSTRPTDSRNPVLRHSRSLPETGRAMHKVSAITDKLSHMSVTSRTRSTVKPPALTLKAGHGKSDFLGKSDEIPPAKRLTRKLVS